MKLQISGRNGKESEVLSRGYVCIFVLFISINGSVYLTEEFEPKCEGIDLEKFYQKEHWKPHCI